MARFHYTAERGDGEVYRGMADTGDRYELFQVVRREGGKIVSFTEEVSSKWWTLSYWNAKFATVPEQEKIIFARNLAAMLKAGLSLARALSVIERQTKNPKFSGVLSQLGNDVRRGVTFNESLGKFPKVFSNLFVAMVRSGEESGDLPNALATISEQMDRAHTIKKKVRSALIYPAIIIVAIIAIGVLMMTQVVPTLAQTFEEMNADLPASTQAVIAVSNFFVNQTIMALALFVIVVGGFIYALRTPQGRRVFEFVIIKTPLIGGVVKELNAARTARTLGSLLSSGVDVVSTIGIAREVVQNSYFRDVLAEAQAGVEKGKPLSESFARNESLYPPLVGEMISVGEETGELSGMLINLAEFYEEEVSRKTKDMSTIIEPFLMVFIGIAVGFFAISMIAPIYSLGDAI